MSRSGKFIELWNEGRVEDALADAAPSYRYQDPVLGGPHDKGAHLGMMQAVLASVPDRRIVVKREWAVGDVEFVEYRWSGTPADGGEPIDAEWLGVFEFEGDVMLGQRHYRGT